MTFPNPQPPIRFNLQRLRFERMSRKCQVDELSAALGISRNAYYKKERGETNITVNELCIILTTLRMPHQEIHYLFIPTHVVDYEKRGIEDEK